MDVLLWYGEITWDYIKQMLPCAAGAAAVFFCLLPWRRKRLSAKMLRSLPIRETALLLFVLFCAGLAALTLFPSNFWGSLLNGSPLPPFTPADNGFYSKINLLDVLASGGSWALFMLLGNVIMFMPLGFFPVLLWRRPRWWKSTVIATCASCFVECVQLYVGRSSDVNDIILNGLGGLAGYGLYRLLRGAALNWVQKFNCTEVDSSHG